MLELLDRLPETFAVEVLNALPAPDRKELLRRHGAKLKITAGNLKRAVRATKECKLLLNSLRRADIDSQRTFLQGWLARRAEMIVHFLDAWGVKHQNGIVEDFSWVDRLDAEKVKESVERLKERLPQLEPIAPLLYFCYLQLPVTAEVLDVDALLKSAEGAAVASDEQA